MRSGCCRWPMRSLGVLTGFSLSVHAIGQGLAKAMGYLSKHGIK